MLSNKKDREFPILNEITLLKKKSDDQVQWVFENLLKRLKEFSSCRAVNNPVVARHRHAHYLSDDNLIITNNWFGGHCADSEYCSLGWIDHCGELINPKHPEVANREASSSVLFR